MLQPGEPHVRERRRSLRRIGLIVAGGAVLIVLVAAAHQRARHADMFPPPAKASLASLSLRQRIVAIVDSQVGYRTDPASTYCNKYSAHWTSGTPGCPQGELAEEWCADFAAWAWQRAGVHFTYGYSPGDISGAAVSFYEWGVHHGSWHAAGSGYRPRPGDIAVYGLDPAKRTAVHVAIVSGFTRGAAGPNVVNGNGDRTGYSVVEKGAKQRVAEAMNAGSALSGYVSPLPG